MFSTGKNYKSTRLKVRETHVQLPLDINNNKYQRRIEVDGVDRTKYFRRPLVEYVSAVLSLKLPSTKQEIVKQDIVTSGKRSIAIQTIYRESSIQTDPFSPNFFVKDSIPTTPEVLTIADLRFGQGLPVGQAELDMIVRAREKRKWIENLPAGTDEKMWEKRLLLMEQFEMNEWEYRENELSK
jgi:hypothetical protein